MVGIVSLFGCSSSSEYVDFHDHKKRYDHSKDDDRDFHLLMQSAFRQAEAYDKMNELLYGISLVREGQCQAGLAVLDSLDTYFGYQDDLNYYRSLALLEFGDYERAAFYLGALCAHRTSYYRSNACLLMKALRPP